MVFSTVTSTRAPPRLCDDFMEQVEVPGLGCCIPWLLVPNESGGGEEEPELDSCVGLRIAKFI